MSGSQNFYFFQICITGQKRSESFVSKEAEKLRQSSEEKKNIEFATKRKIDFNRLKHVET